MAPNLCFCSYRPMLSMVQTYVLEQLNLCFCRQRPIILRRHTDETDEKRRYSTSARACFCHAQVPPFVVSFHRKFSLLPPPLLSPCPRQLLILAPWEHHNEKLAIKRNQCLQLNEMAKAICNCP